MSENYQKKELLQLMNTGANKRESIRQSRVHPRFSK